MEPTLNPSTVFELAAERIEQHGHFKGKAFGPGSLDTAPTCAVGAITAVCDDHDTRFTCYEILNHYLGENAALWNDRESTTAEQVVAALRIASLIAGEKARPVRVYEVGATFAGSLVDLGPVAVAR